jgi:glycosyltransferase involved in cell wall biosynthesis
MCSGQTPITLITAFYNEELLLSRCLESIANQSFKNFELILIDDGSTDNSVEIVKTYQHKFNQLKQITIDNSGLAEARNIGLQNATGAYVTFLDADDTIAPDMMLQFYDRIKKQAADLLISDFKSVDEFGKNEMLTKWNTTFLSISTAQDLADLFYSEGIMETVWAKLFKTELAKIIGFDKNSFFEDRPFLLEYLFLAKTVSFIHKKLILNYRRPSSITRRVLEAKRIDGAYYLFEQELKLVKKYHSKSSFYIHGVFDNALHYFVNTYIIQIIDSDKIENLDHVQNTFKSTFKKFKSKIKQEHITFGIKQSILIFLLSLPKHVGFAMVNVFFLILKKKHIAHIKAVKNV